MVILLVWLRALAGCRIEWGKEVAARLEHAGVSPDLRFRRRPLESLERAGDVGDLAWIRFPVANLPVAELSQAAVATLPRSLRTLRVLVPVILSPTGRWRDSWRSGLVWNAAEHPWRRAAARLLFFLARVLLSTILLVALHFSTCVGVVPGSWVDRLPGLVSALGLARNLAVPGRQLVDEERVTAWRRAFAERRRLATLNLSGRDLRNADLSSTGLVGADLRGADLREARLGHADLSATPTSGVPTCGGS